MDFSTSVSLRIQIETRIAGWGNNANLEPQAANQNIDTFTRYNFVVKCNLGEYDGDDDGDNDGDNDGDDDGDDDEKLT